MNFLLEVCVALGSLIVLLLIAAAITKTIFVVLSGFVRFVRRRIRGKAGVPRCFEHLVVRRAYEVVCDRS